MRTPSRTVETMISARRHGPRAPPWAAVYSDATASNQTDSVSTTDLRSGFSLGSSSAVISLPCWSSCRVWARSRSMRATSSGSPLPAGSCSRDAAPDEEPPAAGASSEGRPPAN
ncbi:hypothetical protein NBM05_12550 [Rothia sp. AR01]|uniref:Uncharacterized protein n=1 Tax=Rothia santali TaxID=2949643 RepID=A0A9X2HEH1_9MICC|nr:hypothetical protein [Rothia santali]MCP3426810.1 hypothetical protein [Rothia santali]